MNREQRIVENEILFRSVNEWIDELSDNWGGVAIEFMCECGDPSCTQVLSLRPGEYEQLRSNPLWFAVLPGHQIEDVERVIMEHERYLIVAKVGEAVERAVGSDPRGD